MKSEGGVIARNPTAGRDFHLLETIEAGIDLQGAEVKSLRAHRANLKDSFARIDNAQAWLHGLDISPYPQAGRFAPEPKRVRRLLLHRVQIERLEGKLAAGGLTMVATRLYFKGSCVKVELALAKGKKAFDKRETIKRREIDREISRALRNRVK
ncbi:MAG: SsrA-binding protein SmpB [Candidatus Omnitrophica bacterium]|nr:SsrA-binding protein SmpB [Candidatus Omnitrophota bacterium]